MLLARHLESREPALGTLRSAQHYQQRAPLALTLTRRAAAGAESALQAPATAARPRALRDTDEVPPPRWTIQQPTIQARREPARELLRFRASDEHTDVLGNLEIGLSESAPPDHGLPP
jgi:hypothetical protein